MSSRENREASTLYLDKAVKEKLQKLAVVLGTTVTELVNEMLLKSTDKHPNIKPFKNGLFKIFGPHGELITTIKQD